jgi:4'-phosphopantetheinyl transferase EntD
MIGKVLPEGVAVGETFADLDEPLFPAEEEAIAQAVHKRRSEFRSVRACARIALAEFGLDRAPMVPNARGASPWPPGVVGSMTHCAGYRAAAVAPADQLTGLGIDGEPHDPLPDGVLDVVALPEEREHLVELGRAHPSICWDRLLFSAKESVYKAWSPLTGRWLGFDDARLTIDPVAGGFTADLLVTGLFLNGRPLTTLTGRWLVEHHLVVTAIGLPAPTSTG